MFWRQGPEMYGLTEHAGAMRAARAAVLPQVPTLAPDLPVDHSVIHRAITASFEESGINPKKVPEANFNKVERHVIAGFLVHRVVGELIELPEHAHPRLRLGLDSSCFGPDVTKNLELFFTSFGEAQRQAAETIARRYTRGTDPQHTWYPAARRRYEQLGLRAAKLESKDTDGLPGSRHPTHKSPLRAKNWMKRCYQGPSAQ